MPTNANGIVTMRGQRTAMTERPASKRPTVSMIRASAGPGADAGLREGDLIEQANGRAVRATEDLRVAIEQSNERPLLLLVNRGGQTIFVTVRTRR